jgi:hypothetical protein
MTVHTMTKVQDRAASAVGDLKICVTKFVDVSANDAVGFTTTWEKICTQISSAAERPTKSACPLLKLATFGTAKTKKGSIRHDANVLRVYGIEADYDAEVMSIDEAAKKLDTLGIEALFYTSASNRLVAPPRSRGGPRWRVLVPLAQPIAPGLRRHYVGILNAAFCGALARESFTLSQAYYFGRVSNVPYETRRVHGIPIDEVQGLPSPIYAGDKATIASDAGRPRTINSSSGREAFEARVADLGRKLRTGDERRQMLKSYIGRCSARGMATAEVRALIAAVVAEFFEPDDPIDDEDIDSLVKWATKKDASRQYAGRADHRPPYLGAETIQAANALVVAVQAGDVGAPFEEEAQSTLIALQAGNPAEWVRLRARLKLAGVRVTELDKHMRSGAGKAPEDEHTTDRLMTLARVRCEFIHDANGEPYAVFVAADARQVLHLDSKAFDDRTNLRCGWLCPRSRVKPSSTAGDARYSPASQRRTLVAG